MKAMKFLVCETDLATVQVIRAALELYGHQVDEAHDEVEALRKVRTEFTDFVILDRTGIGLAPLRTLRDAPWTAEAPVFVLTGCPEDGAIAEAYREGADMVLTKPFNPLELFPVTRRD